MIQLKRNKLQTHVTDELLELVEEKALEWNLSKSSALNEILEIFFDREMDSVNESNHESLKEDIQFLKEKTDTLEKEVSELKKTNHTILLYLSKITEQSHSTPQPAKTPKKKPQGF